MGEAGEQESPVLEKEEGVWGWATGSEPFPCPQPVLQSAGCREGALLCRTRDWLPHKALDAQIFFSSNHSGLLSFLLLIIFALACSMKRHKSPRNTGEPGCCSLPTYPQT